MSDTEAAAEPSGSVEAEDGDDSSSDYEFCGTIEGFHDIFEDFHKNLQEQIHPSNLMRIEAERKKEEERKRKLRVKKEAKRSKKEKRDSDSSPESVVLVSDDDSDDQGSGGLTTRLRGHANGNTDKPCTSTTHWDDDDGSSKEVVNVYDSDTSSEAETEVRVPELMYIRCRWKTDIFKYRLDLHEPVSVLRQKLAETVSMRPDDIMIFRSDDEEFEDYMTLKECNLAIGQVLECLPRLQIPDSEYRDPSVLYLKCQGKGLRTARKLGIKKFTPLKQLRDDYAKLMGLDPEKLRLNFDGDYVDLKSTPASLDLEPGDTIDIVEIP